jgi:hypothetical protein
MVHSLKKDLSLLRCRAIRAREEIFNGFSQYESVWIPRDTVIIRLWDKKLEEINSEMI